MAYIHTYIHAIRVIESFSTYEPPYWNYKWETDNVAVAMLVM
jgi:hypothetical protein